MKKRLDWILSNTFVPERQGPSCSVPCVLHTPHGQSYSVYFGDGDSSMLVPTGASFVSVAGVELRRRADWFRKHGLSDAVLKKLEPFFGQTGACAIKALASAGKTRLTKAEMKDLISAYLRGMEDECAVFFNGTPYPDWRTLPEDAKTALLSLVARCGFGVFDSHIDLSCALKGRKFIDAEAILRKGHTVWGTGWMDRYEEGVLLGRTAR